MVFVEASLRPLGGCDCDFSGVDSLVERRTIADDVMRWSRVTELLRLLRPSGRKSSSDFSLRRRGSVAHLSALELLFSRIIGPILVLMTRLSGVVVLLRGKCLLVLPPIDGQRPSSVDGVPFEFGVRLVMDGVRLNAVTRCTAASFRFVGNESGLIGRRMDADRAINGGLLQFAFAEFCFSRDRALSVVARVGAPHDDRTAARFADAARVLVRATEFSDFGDFMVCGADGSAMATRFFGEE